MPQIPSKTFNIPFSGGAATVVCLFKYTAAGDTSSVYKDIIGVQYNADGTTVTFGYGTTSFSVSANNGVMTATLEIGPGSKITDCRCCLIPGDPFAQGQQKKILRNERVAPILEMYGVVESEARAVSEPVTAERGMEYEYGKYYLDSEDGKTYKCERIGEAAGGKIVLQYLPHELVGNYFTAV